MQINTIVRKLFVSLQRTFRNPRTNIFIRREKSSNNWYGHLVMSGN